MNAAVYEKRFRYFNQRPTSTIRVCSNNLRNTWRGRERERKIEGRSSASVERRVNTARNRAHYAKLGKFPLALLLAPINISIKRFCSGEITVISSFPRFNGLFVRNSRPVNDHLLHLQRISLIKLTPSLGSVHLSLTIFSIFPLVFTDIKFLWNV